MTNEEAIERAERIAEERGWKWEQPIRVSTERTLPVVGKMQKRVVSNAASRGCNVQIVLDDASGELVSAHFLPR